jgi:hypothetical protein
MPGDSKGCQKDAGRKYAYCGRAPTLPRQLTLGISLSHSLFMQRERSPGANHLSQTCTGISMRILSDPHFEACPRSDQRGWVALVTWGHALRHEIDGAIFNCEKEALRWIAENSPQWLARQNVAESSAAAPKATVSRREKVPTSCARPASNQSPRRPPIAAGATTPRTRVASAGRTAAAVAR